MTKTKNSAIIRMILLPIFIAFFLIPLSFGRAACAAIFAFSFIFGMIEKRKSDELDELGMFLSVLADRMFSACALVLLLAKGMSTGTLIWSLTPIFVYLEIAGILVVSSLQLIAATKKADLTETPTDATHSVALAIYILFIILSKYMGLANQNFQAIGLFIMLVTLILNVWSVILYIKEYREIPQNASDEHTNKHIGNTKAPKAKNANKAKKVKREYNVEVDDELKTRGIALAKEYGYVSARLLQKNLRIGYYRACSLAEVLETSGVVAKPDNNGMMRYLGTHESV